MSESNGIDYKAKCEEYERRMGIGDNDPAKEAYLVLVKVLRQQTEYLKDFQLKNHIGGKPSEDGTFVRSQSLWEKLPDMITKVNSLKMELKMEGEEKKNVYKPITAKTIADGDVQ